MPLIVLSGYPSSGKTRRAKQLEQCLKEKIAADPSKSIQSKQVQVLTDSIRKEAYGDANAEKMARGALMSAVDRHLTRDNIVIVDGLNYIKGFRYELYCIAKALGTPHCVVQTIVPQNTIKEWNRQRQDGNAYEEDIMDNLVSRYEEPDSRNRWDSPLFALEYDKEEIPIDKIWDGVVLRKPPPPNFSTVSKPVSSTNYVYELDKITLDIINEIIKTQREGGTSIEHRKQFVDINKVRQSLEIQQIADLFADYLDTNYISSGAQTTTR